MKTLALAMITSFAATAALAATGPSQPKPQVSMEQARAAALKLRPGRIKKQELEKESGGSGLRYSFDIQVKGVVYEVGIDAISGKVLENGRG